MLNAQTPAASQTDQAWPREARHSAAAVLMYEPQIERVTENEVEARPRFG